MLDYHIHALAHGEYRYSYDWLGRFLIAAKNLNIGEIGFSEHDEYINRIDFHLIGQLKERNPGIIIKMGLEVDYAPGREEEIRSLYDYAEFDYIIGSVHFIDGWAFDHPDYQAGFLNRDVDEVYQSYCYLLKKAVESGLFDIIGHIDLVKKWGHRPLKKNVLEYLDPVLTSIKDSDLVIEINSSGLNKPVREIYPSLEVLERIYQMGIPITLGSDAHNPQELGQNFTDAVYWAKKIGFKKLAHFEKRRKKLKTF
jgi:histidinol-phosphatase (PHP family)